MALLVAAIEIQQVIICSYLCKDGCVRVILCYHLVCVLCRPAPSLHPSGFYYMKSFLCHLFVSVLSSTPCIGSL